MNTITRFPHSAGLIAAAAFTLVASSITTLCAAADVNAPRTAVVNYADLNVASPQGATELYGRIRQAAKSVCGPLDGRDLPARAQVVACIRSAMADAVSKVNEPELFAVYNARNSSPLPANLLSQSR
ncbi:MAG: UrcA family protein [Steroidobacteraceae bacterium]